MAVVDFDNKESKWKLVEMKSTTRRSGKWEEVTLSEDEELDSQKLNDLKTALDDLKIVDVRHKPAGLSKDLQCRGRTGGRPCHAHGTSAARLLSSADKGGLSCSRTKAKSLRPE